MYCITVLLKGSIAFVSYGHEKQAGFGQCRRGKRKPSALELALRAPRLIVLHVKTLERETLCLFVIGFGEKSERANPCQTLERCA